MSVITVAEWDICTDCMYAVEGYADKELGSPVSAESRAALEDCRARGWSVANASFEEADVFSTSRCDMCGSTLAGHRFPVVALAAAHHHYYDAARSAWQCRECDASADNCEWGEVL